ncbi:MAG: PfkB family carbohydrate kinase [Merdibacter sp.]
MIITLTLNPSIDYTLTVDEPLLDVEVNRTTSEQMKVGGKGLNVSMMLDKLQIPSRAIALLGGFTGDYIEQALQSYPRIDLTRVPVDGMNRINVKLYHGPGTLCVNARGPEAGSSVRQTLSDLLEEADRTTGCSCKCNRCADWTRGFPDWAVHESASAAGQTGHRHGSPVAPADRTLPAGLDQTQLLRALTADGTV